MGKTKEADTLGVHLRNEVIAEIERRAAGIDKKKGTYAALVLEKWFADGCPPVTEADRLVQLSKRPKPARTIKSAYDIDPWKLDPEEAYILVDDNVVKNLLLKLGVPELFSEAPKEGKFECFVLFDNHPTHWIEVTLVTGYGNKRDDGLTFHALPKSSTPRYEIEKLFRDHCKLIGVKHKGPIETQQIPKQEALN